MTIEDHFSQDKESLESKYYLALKESEGLIEAMMKEIENVLASHDREEAERIISGELGDKMTDAIEKSKISFKNWIDSFK